MAKSVEKPWDKKEAAAAVRAAKLSERFEVNAAIVRSAQDVTGGFTQAQTDARIAIKEDALTAAHVAAVADELDGWAG